MEARFREGVDAALASGADAAGLRAVSDLCWREADAAELRWAAALPNPRLEAAPLPYRRSWARLSQVAGLSRGRG